MKLCLSRRVAVAAVLGMLATASVAGCRVEQGAALFVGDVRITDAEVSQIVDSLPEGVLERLSLGDARQEIVRALVVTEVGKRIVSETGAEPEWEAQAQTHARLVQNGLPDDAEAVSVLSEAAAYVPLLTSGATPTEPDQEDIDAMMENLVEAINGKIPPEYRNSMIEGLRSEVGQEYTGKRHQVLDFLDEYDVSVNPRYGLVEIVIYADPERGTPIVTAAIPQ